jgi:excisionase family DNA binding protein
MAVDSAMHRSKSVREVAAYWRISPRKVRALIRRGLLRAVDLGCGRQQLRITPDAIQECEERLTVKAPAPRRKRCPEIDPEIERILSE